MIALRGAFAPLLTLSLAACGGIIPRAETPSGETATRSTRPIPPSNLPTPPFDYALPVPPRENALGQGFRPGPAVVSLGIGRDQAERALAAFRISCPSIVRRQDLSGLTTALDWTAPCRAAEDWRGDPVRFFTENFRAVEVGSGEAFATGYYEPEIAAARTRQPGYPWPIYGRPGDLLTRREQTNLLPAYRLVDGREQPYFDRAAIENGALAGQGLEIGWARDLVDLYFLQVQGSGLLREPDGSTRRIGYAANNGYPYVSIGRIMLDRGLLDSGQATAEGIAVWLREHPEQGRAIMQENRRYIFFQPLDTSAPLGSLGRPVTPRATVAADPAYVPLGAPVFLDMEHDVADGLWVAQDTGGAIRGANRFDTFWGSGSEAYQIASGMASRGRAYILIPAEAAARLARAN